jgi:DNA-binding transcriptional regulator YhcF (GntR family)
MAAAAMFGNSSACNKMGNYHPILMQIATQTKKSMPSSEIRKPERSPSFKMTAAAILFIEMNAIKWVITTRF